MPYTTRTAAYNLFVRRVLSSFGCFAFALSLHASIPGNAAARFNQSSATVDRPVQSSEQLPLTAAPADRHSFYLEFYATEPLPARVERKPGLFHRITSAIKKTAQKVNLIPN
ncbi:MAG TPA: hypothetical protein VJW20_01385 [Candidatus Angelobacter sp.]|nr:hypothetical protein [Candidatus Angelobacter sp.]